MHSWPHLPVRLNWHNQPVYPTIQFPHRHKETVQYTPTINVGTGIRMFFLSYLTRQPHCLPEHLLLLPLLPAEERKCHYTKNHKCQDDNQERIFKVGNANLVYIFSNEPYDEYGWYRPSKLVTNTHNTDTFGCTFQRTEYGDIWIDRGLQIGIACPTHEGSQKEQCETAPICRQNKKIKRNCKYKKDNDMVFLYPIAFIVSPAG